MDRRDRGTITLEEVGPWRIVRGATVLTTRSIVVTAATEFALVGRVDDGPSGFPGDFIEERLDPWDLRYDDFVTVDCLHRRTTATSRRCPSSTATATLVSRVKTRAPTAQIPSDTKSSPDVVASSVPGS